MKLSEIPIGGVWCRIVCIDAQAALWKNHGGHPHAHAPVKMSDPQPWPYIGSVATKTVVCLLVYRPELAANSRTFVYGCMFVEQREHK